MTRPDWKALRALLWERSEGHCEASGLPLDEDTFDAHHRRPKGMGGTSRDDRDAIWNLLALDPRVHNGGPTSVHAHRGVAEANGFLVPKHDNPRHYPVHLHGQRWVLLTETGGYWHIPRLAHG